MKNLSNDIAVVYAESTRRAGFAKTRIAGTPYRVLTSDGFGARVIPSRDVVLVQAWSDRDLALLGTSHYPTIDRVGVQFDLGIIRELDPQDVAKAIPLNWHGQRPQIIDGLAPIMIRLAAWLRAHLDGELLCALAKKPRGWLCKCVPQYDDHLRTMSDNEAITAKAGLLRGCSKNRVDLTEGGSGC